MTLPTKVKKLLMERYPDAFSRTAPQNIQVVAIDMMQHVKGSLPESIVTVRDLIQYLVKAIKSQLERNNGCHTVIACFDIATVPVKRIVEYGKRKEWRCALCRKQKDADTLDKDCKKDCENKRPLKFEDGPHFPLDDDARLPVPAKQWMRFAADSRNLRAEVYPRLMNCFLTEMWTSPPEGKQIIISGLPCETQVIPLEHAEWHLGYTPTTEAERHILVPWRLDSVHVALDPRYARADMYQRVYRIITRNGRVFRSELPEMKHQIAESDNSIFYFMRFFPECGFLFVINDGDAISIGLLRVLEDFRGGVCPLQRVIALPFRGKRRPGEAAYAYTYVNLPHLKMLIDADEQYTAAGVTNHVATLIFIIILAGTDFFKGFCYGIGYKTEYKEDPEKRAKQNPGVWDTFHARLPMFRALVQWNVNTMIPSPTTQRRIVIDEELFAIFTRYCYLDYYSSRIKSNNVDFAAVRAHCAKSKVPEKRVPSQQHLLLMVRALDWHLNYWVNACRNIDIDPFLKVNGKSYYGYTAETESGITASVYRKQLPVDEVYKRNFYKRAKRKRESKPTTETNKKVMAKRRTDAVSALRGKL